MLCPSCGTENPAGKKFCGNCGTALAMACESCGSPNPPGNRFCGECGASLSAGPAPAAAREIAAERQLRAASIVKERRRAGELGRQFSVALRLAASGSVGYGAVRSAGLGTPLGTRTGTV
jgi:uncharacterized OB-fold protein